MGFGKCTLESGKPNQLVAPSVKKCTAAHKQCAGTGLFQGRKGCVDFLFAGRLERNDFLSHRADCCLYFAGLSLKYARVWILQNRDDLGVRNQLK